MMKYRRIFRRLYATSCVQWEQRVAAAGMSLKHCGQVFIAGGSAGTGFMNLAMSLLTGRTTP
jgi:hypothetical protein